MSLEGHEAILGQTRVGNPLPFVEGMIQIHSEDHLISSKKHNGGVSPLSQIHLVALMMRLLVSI